MELSENQYKDFFNVKGVISEASKSMIFNNDSDDQSLNDFKKQSEEFKSLFDQSENANNIINDSQISNSANQENEPEQFDNKMKNISKIDHLNSFVDIEIVKGMEI